MAISTYGIEESIEIFQGDTNEIFFTLANADGSPLDMTGYSLRLQVRNDYSSTSTILNCTLQNGKLAWVNQSIGKWKLILHPTDTSSIRFTADSPDVLVGVYDMEIDSQTTSPGVKKPWYGSFTIHREVTR